MHWSNWARTALFSVAICVLATPEAEAIEVFAPPGLAAHVADGTVTQVRYGGGVRRGVGGAYRGGGARFAGGAYRGRGGYGYRGGARYGYRGGARYGYRGGYGRYGYRGYGYGYRGYGYGYRPYGYGAAAVGAAAIGAAAAAHHCWIDSYGARVCNYY